MKCAIGIILNEDKKILISKRPPQKKFANLWEFPGGKIEHHESAKEALIRELKEEIGIIPTNTEKFMSFQYDYPNYSVLLEIFLVYDFEGQESALENQSLAWVHHNELKNFTFLAANHEIINKLILAFKDSCLSG